MGLALAAMSTLGWAADNPKAQAEDRLKNAATVLQEIAAAPDKGIPNKVLDGAKCIAIVPKLVQAGFVFGGKHGRGVATCRTATGWSAPAFFTITGGSWGLQIGVEGVEVENPAFDVTPHRYVTAIITERGLALPPLAESLKRLAKISAEQTVATVER